MKTNWQTKNIEDCIEKISYTNKIQRKDFQGSGVFPIISQEQDLINGYWNKESDVFRVSKPVVIFGDHTQILKYIDFDFVLGADGVKLLQPKEFLDTKYFFYFLQNINLRNLGYARHYRLLKEKDISYPESISEQKRIVKILDEAFEKLKKAKENVEKNLQKSNELFESYLNNIFSNPGKDWEEKTLKEVCEKITDGTHQTPTYFENGYIFLSSKNVTSGKIDWDDVRYIDKKQHIEMQKRVSPRRNDILLAKNGTTGVAAIVDKDEIFDIYVSLAHIRTLDFIDPRFMLYFINSPVAKRQFNKRLKGSGVPNLHLEEIREVLIPFPRVSGEQKQIVKKLDQLSEKTQKLETLYKQKLKNIEELKKSILSKAFSKGL